MLLTCPNCRTVYDVPADKMRRARKVRCVSCGNVWKPDLGVKTQDSVAQEWELNRNGGKGTAEEYTPRDKEEGRWQAFGNASDAKDPEWQTFGGANDSEDPEWQAMSGKAKPAPERVNEETENRGAQEAAFSDASDSEPKPSEGETAASDEGFRFYDDEEEPPQFDFNSPSEASELPPDFKIPEFKQPFAPVDYTEKTFWQEWSKSMFFLTLLCIAGVVWLTFFHSVKSVPMAFKTITYEFIERDYKKFLIINASLENKSDKFAYPRRFKVIFYSANGRLLADRAAPSPLGVLPPKETGTLELRFERPPAQSAKAELILDAVDFSDNGKLPAPPEETGVTERQKKLQSAPLKDGTENRSPEEGTQERVLPKPESSVADDSAILSPATEQDDMIGLSL